MGFCPLGRGFGKMGAASGAGAAPASFTPASLPGLVAWYKADTGVTAGGGNVSQVLDQSGNGYTLTNTGNVPLNATALNGRPAFDFLAANAAKLQTALNAVVMGTGTTGSVFIVGQLKAATVSGGRVVSYISTGQVNDWDNATSAAWLMRDSLNNGIQTFRTAPLVSTAIALATNLRLGSIFDGTNVTHYVNNVAGAPIAATPAWGSPGTLAFGSNVSNTTEVWEGPIAEIVVTNSALSAGNRLSLDNYFRTRYGL